MRLPGWRQREARARALRQLKADLAVVAEMRSDIATSRARWTQEQWEYYRQIQVEEDARLMRERLTD